jgi:acyl phosphate:glycerol-3-phosphate acyltransferase
MWQTYLTVALVSYLLGSIPFGYILVKLFLKQDIRQTGSGNIGATNVARSGKKGLAIATLVLDAAKGGLAVFTGARICQDWFYRTAPPSLDFPVILTDLHAAACFAALMAIAGHVFPIWLRFRGGKGVATAIGAFVLVAPVAAMISFAVFSIVFLLFRYVSAASILAALVFPFLAAVTVVHSMPIVTFVLTAAASLLIILKHHANIRRLLNGTEPKFTTKKSALPPDPIQVEKNA